jgi:hypothetical protein
MPESMNTVGLKVRAFQSVSANALETDIQKWLDHAPPKELLKTEFAAAPSADGWWDTYSVLLFYREAKTARS